MRFLCRLRLRIGRIEVHKLPVILTCLLGPELFHGEDVLAHQLETGFVLRAMVLHFVDIPAATDPEDETPAGEPVDTGHVLRGYDRVALRDKADTRSDLQRLGRRRSEGQSNKRIIGTIVLAR